MNVVTEFSRSLSGARKYEKLRESDGKLEEREKKTAYDST